MTTTTTNTIGITVTDADSRSLTVRIDGRIGRPGRYTLGELRQAALVGEPDLRDTYRQLADRASQALTADHRRLVASCHGHEAAAKTEVTGFQGPVSRDENRAAHGNIMVTETCVHCGAERSRNVNGIHVEQGEWH